MSGGKTYPARFPRHAAGIRAQAAQSEASRSWWAREWTRRLEGMVAGGRLGRGKRYALSGQVTSLSVSGSRVAAEVQGARREPYAVALDFRRPEGAALRAAVAAIRAEPVFVARLLADDLPTEVEDAFRRLGLDLFPGGRLGPGRYDVTTTCSCPDYANPCKHVVAVLVLLGEEVARRPLTLMELRGIMPEDLFDED